MENLDSNMEKMIGKRSKLNIYSDSGTLLLPISTIITSDHIKLLKDNGIVLNVGDWQDKKDELAEQSKMIDETVEQVRDFFKEIRRSRKIPLDAIREKIIPNVHKATDGKNLLHLFSELQAKDDYTYRHNIAVGAIANILGKWMKLNERELLQLTTAALLHDVGKMLVPDEILNKPGKLTDEEFTIMKRHTIYGYEILKDTVGITHRQALVALQHHERMDGSGYPLGLKKDKIDLFSRITAVADVFHAMSSTRVYRSNFPFSKVLAEMEKDMYSALDPAITIVFIEKMMSSLIGSTVILSDGRKGKILAVPSTAPIYPLIQIGDSFIDLNKELSVEIEQIVG